MKNRLTLQLKLILVIGGIFLVFIPLTIALQTLRTANMVKHKSVECLGNKATQYAVSIKSELEKSLILTKIIANELARQHEYKTDSREGVDKIIRSVLADNEDFVAFYVIWEKNKFDGKDSLYKKTNWGTDQGRFFCMMYRSGNQILYSPLEEASLENADYYQIPRNTRQPIFTNPYKATYEETRTNDNLIYMTTVGAPILNEKGEFLGLVAVDFDLSRYQSLVANMMPSNEGYAFLLAADNTVVAHPDTAFIAKKSTFDLHADTSLTKYLVTNNNKTLVSSFKDEYTQKKSLTITVPFGLAGSPQQWLLGVTVPTSIVMADIHTMIIFSAILCIISLILISCTVFFTVNYLITRPLKNITSVLDTIANGEIKKATQQQCYRDVLKLSSRTDEIGMISISISTLENKLRNILTEIKHTLQNIQLVSEKLTQTSQHLNHGAGLQSQASQDVSKSIEQISNMLNTYLSEAEHNGRQAKNAASDLEKGGQAVSLSVEVINNIANKISIIEDIAFQTNILALNAAVEAARAGEQGKGFSVVASEVRKLAERSQAAAVEIRNLSGDSLNIANKAGTLISSIVPEMQLTAESIEKFSETNKQQNHKVELINNALSDLENTMNSNINLSTEVSDLATGLSTKAQELANSIHYFKL